MMQKAYMIIVFSTFLVLPRQSICNTSQDIDEKFLKSIIEDNLFHKINNDLQKTTNKLFTALKLNKSFSDHYETRLLLAIFASLKEVSEKKYHNYKMIKKASRLDKEFQRFENDSLFKLDIPVDEIVAEDFQVKNKTYSKPRKSVFRANSIEIPEDSDEAVILLREFLTNEENVELADIEKPSQKIKKIYEKHKRFRRARRRNFKKWVPPNSTELELKSRRVFNGRQVASKQFPFVVSIHVKGRCICSGSIISRNMILTAASCFNSIHYNPDYLQDNPKIMQVRIGSEYPDQGGDVIEATNFYIYPRFEEESLRNNIGIIKIKKHLHLRDKDSKIRRISYQHVKEQVPVSLSVITVLGWGNVDSQKSTKDLKKDVLSVTHLNLVHDIEKCVNIYTAKYVGESNFCAGLSSKGAGACQRDIGGPGVVGSLLVGVISFGPLTCGTPNAPTIFTNIGYYSDWIDTIVKSKSSEDPKPSDTNKKSDISVAGSDDDKPEFVTMVNEPPDPMFVPTSSFTPTKTTKYALRMHSSINNHHATSKLDVFNTPEPQQQSYDNVPFDSYSAASAQLLETSLKRIFQQKDQDQETKKENIEILPMIERLLGKKLAQANPSEFHEKIISASQETRGQAFVGFDDQKEFVGTTKKEVMQYKPPDILRNAARTTKTSKYEEKNGVPEDSTESSDNYENLEKSGEKLDPMKWTLLDDPHSDELITTPRFSIANEVKNAQLISDFVKYKLAPINSNLYPYDKNTDFEKQAEHFLVSNFNQGRLHPLRDLSGLFTISSPVIKNTIHKIRNLTKIQNSDEEEENPKIQSIVHLIRNTNLSSLGNMMSKNRIKNTLKKSTKGNGALRHLNTPAQMKTGVYSEEVTGRTTEFNEHSVVVNIRNNENKNSPHVNYKTSLEKEIVKRLMSVNKVTKRKRSHLKRNKTVKRLKGKLKSRESKLRGRSKHKYSNNKQESLSSSPQKFKRPDSPQQKETYIISYRQNSKETSKTDIPNSVTQPADALYSQYDPHYLSVNFDIDNATPLDSLFRADLAEFKKTEATDEPKTFDYYYYLPELKTEDLGNLEEDFFNIMNGNEDNVELYVK